MDLELPKRLFRQGNEPQVEKINNSCKMTLLKTLQKALPDEYDEVRRDPVFAKIMAIKDNCLGYSGKLIHSFMCKQLIIAKRYELWFVFARRPLRFSLQEFYAVTGLKYQNEDNCDFEDWKDDMGFWSKLLKRGGKISIKAIKDEHLKDINKWKCVDRLRLMYLCVIAGVILAKDEKVNISHDYIKLVMNIDKLRVYPWGLHAFDLLVSSIIKTREKLKQKKSYVLDGFSYAFQIWIMEAIPDFGIMLGRKFNEDLIAFPICSNWSGAAKVSYDEIIQLEASFGAEGVLYPYISSTGNCNVLMSAEFLRDNEINDERVDRIFELSRNGNDWSDHEWEFVESGELDDEKEIDADADTEIFDHSQDVRTPIAEDISGSGSVRGKNRVHDHGAETRKQKLLCQRSAAKHGGLDEDMKCFIQGLFHISFTSLEEKLEKKIEDRFGKIESELTQLKDSIKKQLIHKSLENHLTRLRKTI